MFASIAATIGPLVSTEIALSPTGTTTIRARSKSGKSHLPACLLFALYGCDEYGDALDATWTPPGQERIDVRVTTGKGAVWGRTLKATADASGKTVSRSYSRLVVPTDPKTGRPLDPQHPGSDAAMTALLPEVLTRDPELVRCIVAPMVWRSLAESEGSGRKLTLLLERVLGKGDVRAEVARLLKDKGHVLGERDAVDPKGAEAQRATANKAAATAKGAAEEARRALVALPGAAAAEGPTEAEQDAARDVLAALTSWEDFGGAREVWDRLVKAHAETEAKLATWRTAVAELGARPAVDAEAVRAASARLVSAREAATNARTAQNRRAEELLAAGRALDAAEALQTDEAITTAEAALGKARAELAAAEAKAGPLGSAPCGGAKLTRYLGQPEIDCSTCQFLTDATAAAATLDTLRAAVTSAEAAVSDARCGFPSRKAKAIDDATDAHKKTQEAASRASEATKKAEAEEEAAGKAQAQAATAGEAAATWDTSRRAIGDEPKPTVLPAEPATPDEPRPTAEAVTAAKATLQAARDGETVAKERAKRRADAEAAVTRAEAAEATATAEAARCEALVEAVRKAPGEIAARQLGALGDLGPCSVHFLPGGGCEVRVNGRSWERARSGGERILADAWFRVALARAAKMEWLTIFVDEAQLLTGEAFPTWTTAKGTPRPIVLMEGADCDLVSSAAAEPAKAAS